MLRTVQPIKQTVQIKHEPMLLLVTARKFGKLFADIGDGLLARLGRLIWSIFRSHVLTLTNFTGVA